ncbi:MAG TPA: SLC13 family permease [Longimicrobiales bacterium]
MHVFGIATVAAAAFAGPAIGPVPIEFVLFGIVLACVALFHKHTLAIAVTGVTVITLYKIFASPFATGPGLLGFGRHLEHEWVIVVNLGLLLLGFALLARQFEDTRVPAALPRILPSGWMGGFVLLIMIFVLSSFLDNIAAALIGGAMAHAVFRGKVHVGYLAAIVAASNAGGAGSVVGDTTTTMMWIAGVSPLEVVEAFVGGVAALLVFGIPAAMLQHRHSPIVKSLAPADLVLVGAHGEEESDEAEELWALGGQELAPAHSEADQGAVGEASLVRIDWPRVGVVACILAAAVIVNVTVNVKFHEISDVAPFLGMAVWAAILVTALVRKPEWTLLPNAFKGAVFLLSLVLCASMMPVEKLPPAGWHTAMGLGFLSSVFDNIPLTALTLVQGGYDWGFVAFAVGFGGSMIWFGSSAGVALSSMYPEAKNALQYLRKGWFVTVAYIVGFMVMLQLIGFHPGSTPRTVQQIESPTPIEATH